MDYGIRSINSYQQMPFLTATKPVIKQGYQYKGLENKNAQALAGVPFSADQYELAQQISEGKMPVNINATNSMHQAKNVDSSKGALWGEGLKFAEYNGTGELQPEGRVEGLLGDNLYCMG